MEYPYQVINPDGETVLQSKVRHSARIELDLLERGYAVKLNGKRLTKTEVRKDLGRK